MRGGKAESGWGVVCTEEIEISPCSEIAPHFEDRLWDDSDIPAQRLMSDACHAHCAMAGALAERLRKQGLEAAMYAVQRAARELNAALFKREMKAL